MGSYRLTWQPLGDGHLALGHKPGDKLRKALADPKVRDTLAAQGADPLSNTPAQFRRIFLDEFVRWGKVRVAAGMPQQ